MVEKIKNPFTHSQDEDCDPDPRHEHEPFEPADPAQQSLADAMRVSFGILKLLMIAVLLAYAGTGVFMVDPQEQVVRLQFGKIIGDGGEQVYTQGWYLGWPYPIEEKIKVSTIQRTVVLRDAFWYEVSDADATKTPDQMYGQPLNPEKDGSLLTADANIVHGRFQINYQISDIVKFVQNVGMPKPKDYSQADALVTAVAERGIVYTAARVTADQFINRNLDSTATIKRMQASLDALNAGITITVLRTPESTPPLMIRKAYTLVTDAESERGQKISAARQQSTSLLNEAAGEAHNVLFELVKSYELARSVGDGDEAQKIAQQIDVAFDQLRLPDELGALAIGGEAARLINEANTYRTETVEQVKAEANSFASLYEQYRSSPELVSSRMWQNVREKIFTGDVETFYTNAGQTQIITNTDPQISRDREKQRLLQAEQDAYETGTGR
jgi:modulator of FtsH protease HflK